MERLSEAEAFRLLLYALIVGAVLGIIWDIFRVTRIAAFGRKKRQKSIFVPLPADTEALKQILRVDTSEKHSVIANVGVFLSDLGFCVFSAICVILMLFHISDGVVRGFAFAGAFIGFAIYYFTVGRLTVIFSDAIIRILKRLLRFVLSLTLFPILKLLRGIAKKALSIIKKHRLKRIKNKNDVTPNKGNRKNERNKRKKNHRNGKRTVLKSERSSAIRYR